MINFGYIPPTNGWIFHSQSLPSKQAKVSSSTISANEKQVMGGKTKSNYSSLLSTQTHRHGIIIIYIKGTEIRRTFNLIQVFSRFSSFILPFLSIDSHSSSSSSKEQQLVNCYNLKIIKIYYSGEWDDKLGDVEKFINLFFSLSF